MCTSPRPQGSRKKKSVGSVHTPSDHLETCSVFLRWSRLTTFTETLIWRNQNGHTKNGDREPREKGETKAMRVESHRFYRHILELQSCLLMPTCIWNLAGDRVVSRERVRQPLPTSYLHQTERSYCFSLSKLLLFGVKQLHLEVPSKTHW